MCKISAAVTVVAWRPPNEQQIFYRAALYKVKAPLGGSVTLKSPSSLVGTMFVPLFLCCLNAADETVCCTQVQIRNHCTIAQPVGPFAQIGFLPYFACPVLGVSSAFSASPGSCDRQGQAFDGRVQRELKKNKIHAGDDVSV